MRAEDNRRVIGLGFKVDVMIGGGGERHLHIAERFFQLHQFRHQPANGAGRGFQADNIMLLTRLVSGAH